MTSRSDQFLSSHPVFARWSAMETTRLLHAVGFGIEHPITGRRHLIPRPTAPASHEERRLAHWTPLGTPLPYGLGMLWARMCARQDAQTRPWDVVDLLTLAEEGERLDAMLRLGVINVARGVQFEGEDHA
jgi:hypothetical protein